MSVSYAQSNMDDSEFVAGQDITFEMEKKDELANEAEDAPRSGLMPLLDNVEQQESTVIEDDYSGDYKQPTVANLSKLYWKKDALDLADNTAIDNFLLINECKIYKEFYEDDFEWLRVRKAARKMISENKDSFTDKYQIILPIDLGRYDMDGKGFPLINDTAFMDLRRIEIGGNSSNAEICGNNDTIKGYPRNVILVLSKPFQFDFLQLDEHIAQAYIIRQRYDPVKRPKNLRNKSFNRLAFARIRITFDKYHGNTKGIDGEPLAIMFGKLDGIDFFEDPHEKRLLKSINLED
jgi:hypothetical protein